MLFSFWLLVLNKVGWILKKGCVVEFGLRGVVSGSGRIMWLLVFVCY